MAYLQIKFFETKGVENIADEGMAVKELIGSNKKLYL